MCIISFLDEGYKNMNKNNNNTGISIIPSQKLGHNALTQQKMQIALNMKKRTNRAHHDSHTIDTHTIYKESKKKKVQNNSQKKKKKRVASPKTTNKNNCSCLHITLVSCN